MRSMHSAIFVYSVECMIVIKNEYFDEKYKRRSDEWKRH